MRRAVLVGLVTALLGLAACGDGGGTAAIVQASTAVATSTTSATPTTEAPMTAPPTTAVPTSVSSTELPTTRAAPSTSTEPPATTVAPVPPTPTSVVTQVIDGDTIVIDTGDHIRFIGVDTPERGHCGYAEATANMRNMVYGKAVILTAGARDDIDKYGRLLRYVDLPDGTDTGLAQITGGFAVARYDTRDGYGHHPREEEYVAADTGAAANCVYGSGTPATTAPPSTNPPDNSAYYANCAAARAAGAAPLHLGDPGYRKGLDRDGDGVACE
jgi:endonuclease YncB( thermonuclease family)